MEDSGFLKPTPGFATAAIHVGQDPSKWNSSAVVPPIVTATTYKQPAPAEHTVRIYLLIFILNFVYIISK